MYRSILLATAASLTLLSPAQAQDTTSEDDPTWRQDTIIVTGQQGAYSAETAGVARTSTPLSEIPQSIQVITPTLLKEQEASTLSEALLNVSGVVPSQPSELVLANPVVRGFEAEIYVDGLIGYGDTAVIDPASLVTVERIEVAKGPTSVLFGGGTGAPVGGLINVVTKTPQAEAFTRVGLRAGSFAALAPNIDINLPIGERAGFRLPAEYVSSEDFIDEVEIERITLAPSFGFAPTDQTDVLVRLGYNRVEQLEYAGLPSEVADLPGVDPLQFTGAADAPNTEIENLTVHGTVEHRFSEALSGTFQLRRFESSFREFSTSPFLAFFPITGTGAPIVKGQLPVDTIEWTADASLTAELETGAISHTILAGVTWDDTNYQGGTGFDFTPIGVYDYVTETPELNFGAVPPVTNSLESDYKTLALYAQNQMSFGERFHVLLGGRYSQYELTEIEGGQGTDETFDQFDPRIGATFEVTDSVSLFAGWATGSRLSLFFASADGSPPELETSESFEAGLKFNAEAFGLSGTIAGFQITRENVPTPDPSTFITSIQTGEQESSGVELDLVWEPTSQVSVLISTAFTDSEVTLDTSIPVGDAIPRVPDQSGRIAARYRFDGALEGLGAGLGLTWASEADITLPNSFQSDDYAVFDAQVSYEWNRYRLGLNVQNLTDEEYFLPYQYFAQAVVRPGAPLSAFVTLSADF